MSKKRSRLEIKVDAIPAMYMEETASCPVCGRDAQAIGRTHVQLVCRCAGCKVVFKRNRDWPYISHDVEVALRARVRPTAASQRATSPPVEGGGHGGRIRRHRGRLRRVAGPGLEAGRMPNSLLVEVGRMGVDRYLGYMLAFMGRRVLGQYGPQLLGAEPMGAEGLYLVETNVEEWQRHANLPEEDLRRWLILHEMTHAWQFAAHPWLRPYMEQS